jgi:hypothetical protein
MPAPVGPNDTDEFPCPTVQPCPQCGTDLDLHQPDDARPERLFGACPACGCWFLVNLREGLVAPLEMAGPDAGG